MFNGNIKEWAKAAAIRAVKTVAQTAIATIGTSAAMGDVNWALVGSASLLADILSLLTSVAGLPEVQPDAGSMTVDAQSGNPIRKTDNGLRYGDMEAPQHARPLTNDEIAEIVKGGE